jgi:hypothetical protein
MHVKQMALELSIGLAVSGTLVGLLLACGKLLLAALAACSGLAGALRACTRK